MNIIDLKINIENKTLSDSPMIWKITDSSSLLITNQYFHEIANFKNLEIKLIDTTDEIPDTGFIEDTNLYIIKTKEFNSPLDNFKNCIVICEKTNLDCIKIPKLEKWQLDDFVMGKLPGINKNELLWLSNEYGDNYFGLINEIEKLSLFNKNEQADVFNLLKNDGEFNSITSLNIWDLSNGILKRDRELVQKVLEVIDYIDVEPIGLLTVLYNNFRRVIDIQTNPRAIAKDLGISDKQLYAIKKNNCGYYSKDELVRIFKLLTSLEYKYKFEGLSLNNLIDYMVCNILEG